VIGAANDFPRIAVIIYMRAPGQRLVANANAAFGSALAQFTKIRRSAINATHSLGMARRAEQHQISAKLLHQIKFAFGTIKGFGAQPLRQAFKIAKGLKQRDLKPVIADHPGDLARASLIGNEILLKNLDPVKAGARYSLKLFTQTAGDRHSGNGGFHADFPEKESVGASENRARELASNRTYQLPVFDVRTRFSPQRPITSSIQISHMLT
jgi:hypothetical protein